MDRADKITIFVLEEYIKELKEFEKKNFDPVIKEEIFTLEEALSIIKGLAS